MRLLAAGRVEPLQFLRVAVEPAELLTAESVVLARCFVLLAGEALTEALLPQARVAMEVLLLAVAVAAALLTGRPLAAAAMAAAGSCAFMRGEVTT